MNNLATQTFAVKSFDNFFIDMEGADIQSLSNSEMQDVDGGILPLLLAFSAGVTIGYAAYYVFR